LARAQVQAGYHEVSRARLPQLSARGTYDKSDDPATQLPDANNALLHLEQSLQPFSPAWIEARQKKTELAAAEFSRVQTLRDVELRIRQLYLAILEGQETVVNINLVEEQLKKLLTAVLPRYTMGRAPPFDLVKVKVAIAELERSRSLEEAHLRGERSELAQTMGLDALSGYDLVAMNVTPTLPAEDELLRSLEFNPNLRSLKTEADAARLGIRAARYARLPSLVGAAEYGYSGRTAASTALGWDASLGLRLNLFDWGILSSRISRENSAAALADTRLDLERQKLLTQALEDRARAQAHLADMEILKALLPETKESAVASIERYKRGATGILEATEAVNLWLGTLLNERSAYYSYLSDFADLVHAGGREAGPDGF